MDEGNFMINDQALRRALREANATGSPARPSMTADQLLLAATCRRARAFRIRTALALASAAAATAVIVSVGTRNFPLETPPLAKAAPSSIDQIQTELAALEREANWRLRMARGLAEAERLAAQEAAQAVAPHQPEIWRQETSRSAAISWQYATMVEHDFHDAERARREYRRISERFHDTPWAALAAASLERLSIAAKGPSSM
jgi:signal transduction histidine kinase